MATQRNPSVKDVAAAAGVSLGTVSNVLNRPERVSETTLARVRSAMDELGFVRNESARQLRSGTSRMLAYVVLDARNPFFTDVAQGAEQTVDRAGLSLFLADSDNNPDKELRFLELLQQQRVQGVLITPVDPESPVLDQVAAHGVPIVVVDRTPTGDRFCSVAVDDVLGGRLAAEHLIDRGHRRIALVGGPASIGQVADRWRGAAEAFDDAGLTAAEDADLVPLAPEALTVAAGRAAGQLLAGMPARRRPTAAFCANDLVALGLLQFATGHGWAVPEDLAIVGYDDIDLAAAAAVPLTSVRQPRRILGETAARLLLDEGDNPDHRHEQLVLLPDLVARRSTLGTL